MRVVRMLLIVVATGFGTAAAAVLLTGRAGASLGTLWHSLAPESLNLAQAVTQRYIHPAVWDDVLLPVLLTPAVVVFLTVAAAALLSYLLVRRRNKSKR